MVDFPVCNKSPIAAAILSPADPSLPYRGSNTLPLAAILLTSPCSDAPRRDTPPCESSLYPACAPTGRGRQVTFTVTILTSLALCLTTPGCPWTETACLPWLGSATLLWEAILHVHPLLFSWAQASCLGHLTSLLQSRCLPFSIPSVALKLSCSEWEEKKGRERGKWHHVSWEKRDSNKWKWNSQFFTYVKKHISMVLRA